MTYQYCGCGARIIDSTGGSIPRQVIYDIFGEIIFIECAHGVVILDKIPKSNVEVFCSPSLGLPYKEESK